MTTDEFDHYVFCGEERNTIIPLENLLDKYPLNSIDKSRFISSLRQVYAYEKECNGPNSPGIDLENRTDVERMNFHLKTHTIVGLLEFGTSNNLNIPYWDVQAFIRGLSNVGENQEALQRNYIESINALSGYIIVAEELRKLATTYEGNISDFASLGRVTMKDHSEIAISLRDTWKGIKERVSHVIYGKYKHLLFLSDQVYSKDLRLPLLSRIKKINDAVNLELDSVFISPADLRLIPTPEEPTYKISGFKQLAYLNQSTYSVKEELPPTFTHEQIIKSIKRYDDSQSNVINPKTDISLPWKFTNQEMRGKKT